MATALSTLQFVHRIGDDKTLTIPCYDSSGTAVDMSAGTRTLSARAYPGSSTETFDESTSGVTLTGTTTGVTLAFTEAAINSVTPGTYIFNVSHTTGGGVTTTYPINDSFVLVLMPKVQ